MRFVELRAALHRLRMKGPLLCGLLAIALLTAITIADVPITSSSFAGAENPLSENGAWVPIMAFSPYGTQFQKNDGAYPDRLSLVNHAGARTTAAVPDDHYSEIVVGHVADGSNNVGVVVRVQTSGATADSNYLWWASVAGGVNSLYRMDANVPDNARGTSYTETTLVPTSPVVDGDRLRLIARGPVIYGLKNGVRDFIYNTAANPTKYSAGSTGIFAYAHGAVTNSVIASWQTGPAPVSSGTWASSNFAGTENPLDEGDRWYPLPGYLGFRKAGGQAIGLWAGHNISGVWSIAPPATQYSEVTLGAVAEGAGGPVVRIDRTSPGQTGWLLFLYAPSPSASGIYKLTPDGNFVPVQQFTPTIVSGDKWRLTATGNTLEVFRNGVSQLTYTTDGSYPTGDVGIHTYTDTFTFTGWEGGDIAGGTSDTIPPTAPTNPTATAVNDSQINLAWNASIDNVGVTGYTVERCLGAGCAIFTQIATTSGTFYSDTGLMANTSYSYRVRATDAAGNLSPYSNVASATTAAGVPTIASFTPASGPVGTSVTIGGTNFSGATAVTFNGTAASFTVTSATEIQATVPAAATTGPLSVTTPGGTATSAASFTVVPPAPAITGFTPASGPVGTTVTISGANFSGTTAVTFNGVNAAYAVTPTAIQATVPAAATTGPLSVTTPGGTATSAASFTVVAPAPAITSFTPATGPVGTTVTISGTNFSGATAVTFNGVNAAFTVTSATGIQATVPVAATTGPLSVTTPGGTATSAGNYAVTVTLTVNKTSGFLHIGNGTVTSSPGGINCGANCSASYNLNTVVTLTATPGFLSMFNGWTGCDSVSGMTCTVTTSRARTVTANFLP